MISLKIAYNYIYILYYLSNVIYASGLTFPGLVNAIENYKSNSSSVKLIDDIKLELSIVIYSIQSASSILKEPNDFSRYYKSSK